MYLVSQRVDAKQSSASQGQNNSGVLVGILQRVKRRGIPGDREPQQRNGRRRAACSELKQRCQKTQSPCGSPHCVEPQWMLTGLVVSSTKASAAAALLRRLLAYIFRS